MKNDFRVFLAITFIGLCVTGCDSQTPPPTIQTALETVEEQVLIDSSIGRINFSLSWREGDLDLTLVQPDGGVVDPSMAVPIQHDTVYLKDPISFSSKAYEEYYVIAAPQPGLWKMRIYGKTTQSTRSDYMLEAWASGATTISANFDKERYSSGDPIKLSVSIEDSISTAQESQNISTG